MSNHAILLKGKIGAKKAVLKNQTGTPITSVAISDAALIGYGTYDIEIQGADPNTWFVKVSQMGGGNLPGGAYVAEGATVTNLLKGLSIVFSATFEAGNRAQIIVTDEEPLPGAMTLTALIVGSSVQAKAAPGKLCQLIVTPGSGGATVLLYDDASGDTGTPKQFDLGAASAGFLQVINFTPPVDQLVGVRVNLAGAGSSGLAGWI